MTLRTLAVLVSLLLIGCPGVETGDDGGVTATDGSVSASDAGSVDGGGVRTDAGSVDAGKNDGGFVDAGVVNPPATLSSIAITPVTVQLGVTESQALTATGTFSDTTTRDLTASVTWASDSTAVVTITASGVITAVAEGMATITASQDGKSATLTVTVSGQGLSSIAVTPANYELGVGSSLQFVATGTYADGSTRNISGEVNWSSSAPTVASVASKGLVTAASTGTTSITAALRGKSGKADATVGAKTVAAIAISPPNVVLKVGETRQLTATGTYSDGSSADITSSVSWSVDSTSTDVASITAGGVFSGTGPRQGIRVIANFRGVEATTRNVITTTEFGLVGITFKPEPLLRGITYGGMYPDANFGGIGQNNFSFVTFTSSNPAVLTVDQLVGFRALSVGSSVVTAVTYTATAMLSSSGTVTVSEPVPDSIAVSSGASGTATLAQGSTLKLTATGVSSLFPALNADLSTQVTWSSSNPAAVTVDATGLARGVGTGTAAITATLGPTMGSTTLNVPSNVPPMMSTTLTASEDNSVFISSLRAADQTTVYPTNAFFSSPGIGVGCAWYWNPAIGPAPERFDTTCSEGLIKFDLSSLAGKTVLSARLRLTASAYGIGSNPRKWSIYAYATPWSGASVTWYQTTGFQHYVYSETQQFDPPTQVGQVFEIDVTNTTKAWVGGAYVNAGLRLGINNYLYPYVRYNSLDPFEFHSREDVNGRGPKLNVTYQ